MDKKKVRKCLSKAHKDAEPFTDRLSHKDMRHVKDSMQDIGKALRDVGGYSTITDFCKKHNISSDNGEWYRINQNTKQKNQLTTNEMMNVIKSAKAYIKKNF